MLICSVLRLVVIKCLWLPVAILLSGALSGFLCGISKSVVVVCVMVAACGKGHVFL